MSSKLKPIVAAKTDVGGRERNGNSVLVFVSPTYNCALLIMADGMGGLGSDGKLLAKFASQMVIDTIHHELRDLLVHEGQDKTKAMASRAFSEDYFVERFDFALRAANSALSDHQPSDKQSCGRATSEVVLAFVQASQVLIANTGFCRAYHFRDGKLRLITNNWAYVPHPGRLFTGPAVGEGTELRVCRCNSSERVEPTSLSALHLYIWEKRLLQAGDRLLLCNDGVWVSLGEANMEEQLSQAKSPEEAVQQLIDTASSNDTPIDIGIVVCDMLAN